MSGPQATLTVRPAVAAKPANVTVPEHALCTGVLIAAAMSMPRCWPAAKDPDRF